MYLYMYTYRKKNRIRNEMRLFSFDITSYLFIYFIYLLSTFYLRLCLRLLIFSALFTQYIHVYCDDDEHSKDQITNGHFFKKKKSKLGICICVWIKFRVNSIHLYYYYLRD